MSIRVCAWATPVVAAAIVLGSPAGWADLYRCQGPNGRITYTDNAGSCPQARKHETTGTVQTVPSAPPRAPRPTAFRGSASLPQQAAEAAEASWRQKKAQSEHELEQLEMRRESLRQAVTGCNRGGELWQKDDAGIKRKVSCRKVKGDFEGLESRLAHLRHYLDGGLEDECRRAGCLPGWIR